MANGIEPRITPENAVISWNAFFRHQRTVYRSGRLDELDPDIRLQARERTVGTYKALAYRHPPTRYFLRNFNLLRGEYIFLSTPAAYADRTIYILTNYRFIFQERDGKTHIIPLRTIAHVSGKQGLRGVTLTFTFKDGTNARHRLKSAPGEAAFRSLINDATRERLTPAVERELFGFRTRTDPVPPLDDGDADAPIPESD